LVHIILHAHIDEVLNCDDEYCYVNFNGVIRIYNPQKLEYLADLALEMVKEKDTLAYARGDDNLTGLHVLARTSGCGCQTRRCRKHLLPFCK